MGRIECGDGEDGEPVGAHRADPDGRQRAGMPAGAWMINWGGCEASVASHIFAVSTKNLCPQKLLLRSYFARREWEGESASQFDPASLGYSPQSLPKSHAEWLHRRGESPRNVTPR